MHRVPSATGASVRAHARCSIASQHLPIVCSHLADDRTISFVLFFEDIENERGRPRAKTIHSQQLPSQSWLCVCVVLHIARSPRDVGRRQAAAAEAQHGRIGKQRPPRGRSAPGRRSDCSEGAQIAKRLEAARILRALLLDLSPVLSNPHNDRLQISWVVGIATLLNALLYHQQRAALPFDSSTAAVLPLKTGESDVVGDARPK